jgi:outer membrane protein assembly factor BamB
LAAAWERTCRLAKRNKENADRRELDFEIARFISIIEGRLKVTVPRCWAKSLRSGEPEFDHTIEYWRFVDYKALPEQQKTIRSGDRLAVEGNQALSIPYNRPVTAGNPHCATTLHTEKQTYVAFYDWPPLAYSLHAFDPDTKDPKWSTVVSADSIDIKYSGAGTHTVEMIAGAESIWVFGSSGNMLYIEAFSTTTGANQWRFNNLYSQTFKYVSKRKPK